ncbi:inactive leucine-rich repeat receptor-like protein kinase-like [Dorcoceras hygrometricum]|uniref:Inactive leucine-rich repeat receptor-like protein kinase-like n=1 Tax=Dorcoceras hygrometricum TaxID=472368 RepID=A0A2Z7CXJ8_9LAMI|nr:inactive leucine-rich repeat receptor-like protein kinase-like [Dorcoceras hygrometricum]
MKGEDVVSSESNGSVTCKHLLRRVTSGHESLSGLVSDQGALNGVSVAENLLLISTIVYFGISTRPIIPQLTQTTQKQEKKYEVKPQYEELSKQLIMQHAIINAMKCMRAIKDRIARPVNQLVLQVYVGINNKGKAQNREELLHRSSKPTNEQPDEISQQSSNEQQLCASSSILSTASIKKQTLHYTTEHQNDIVPTNQNDVVALHQLIPNPFRNNQQLVTLKLTQNDDVSRFPLTKVKRRRLSSNSWSLKPTAGPSQLQRLISARTTVVNSAGTIPLNATADSATTDSETTMHHTFATVPLTCVDI